MLNDSFAKSRPAAPAAAKKKTVTALHPAYYTKFSCTGPECPDHCCRNWSIVIDKNTYMRYRKIRDAEFVRTFQDRVKRIKTAHASDGNYAQFSLTPQGDCSYLQEDGLCGIQKQFGHGLLCVTCQIYPRLARITKDDKLELSMTTSCPVVARLALLPIERMAFQISELDIERGNPLLKSISRLPDPDGAGGKLVPYVWEVRDACIDILQCRSMPLAGRLFALGMMLNKLTEMEKSGEADGAPSVAAAYVAAARSGEFPDGMDFSKDNPSFRAGMQSVLMDSVINVAKSKSREKGDHSLPLRCFTVAVAKWMRENNLDQADFGTIYTFVEAYIEKHWQAFLSRYEHVLENYFVNLVFAEQFPFFYRELTPYQHFIALAEQYAMMRMLLCVNAGESEGVTQEQLIQVVVAMSLDVIHNKHAERIVKAYHGTGNDTLAHIAFLLR